MLILTGSFQIKISGKCFITCIFISYNLHSFNCICVGKGNGLPMSVCVHVGLGELQWCFKPQASTSSCNSVCSSAALVGNESTTTTVDGMSMQKGVSKTRNMFWYSILV